MTLTALGLFGLTLILFVWGGITKQPTEKKAVAKKVIKPYVMQESRTVYTRSTKDITKLFKEIDYSMARWLEGHYEIPRVYLTDISSRWGKQARRIDVKTKKAIFFQLTLPLILHSNEMILIDRQRLLELLERYPAVEADEMQWLQEKAKYYKLAKRIDEPLDREKLDELVLRMHIIPPSLAMAQAAEESGWGTSRFAILGNSLFGQWDFSGKGMIPSEQRSELGNYGLKRFDTPLDAVRGYMRNLNTHRAYRKLRARRAMLEARGEPISGYALAETLDKYSERGVEYVKSLHKMMHYNQLAHADEAYLWDKETIFMTPMPDPKPNVVKTVPEKEPESAVSVAAEENATQPMLVTSDAGVTGKASVDHNRTAHQANQPEQNASVPQVLQNPSSTDTTKVAVLSEVPPLTTSDEENLSTGDAGEDLVD